MNRLSIFDEPDAEGFVVDEVAIHVGGAVKPLEPEKIRSLVCGPQFSELGAFAMNMIVYEPEPGRFVYYHGVPLELRKRRALIVPPPPQ